jgi:hypothetical protein
VIILLKRLSHRYRPQGLLGEYLFPGYFSGLKWSFNSEKAYVFEKLPSNTLASLMLNSTHLHAPDDAKDEILQWIEQLVLFF